MIKKTSILLLFGIMTLASFNIMAQTDSLSLIEIKNILSGKWKRDGRITSFIYEFGNDSTGTWRTEGIISTAPLFKIYNEQNKWYLGSIDILGTGEPYPFEIVTLNRRELVLKDNKAGSVIKYKRKKLCNKNYSQFWL